MGRALLQSERNAMLLIDVLRSYVATKKFQVLDFVVMPDHVHLLISVDDSTSIEKAMQFIKGEFSYRLKKESGYAGEVWQHGFSEIRVKDHHDYLQYRAYIAQNPVKAGLADASDKFPFCFTWLAEQKAQGLKPTN
jgi:putative transposase